MIPVKNIYNDQEVKERTNALLDVNKAPEIIPEVIDFDYDARDRVGVIDSLWEDSGLHEWIRSLPITEGGKYHIWNLLRQPTYNTELLEARQKAYETIPDSMADKLREIAEYEKDVSWLFTLPPLKEAYPINILFPSIPILNNINKLPYFLTLFHIYRISIMPWFNLVSPIVTIFSPWFYLKKINVNISLKTYFHAVWKGIKMGISGGIGSPKFTKNLTILIYFGLYIYGIVQTFESAHMLYKIRENLAQKTENIRKFVATSQELIQSVPLETIKSFAYDYTLRKEYKLSQGLSGLYNILTEKPIQGVLLSLLRGVYALDVCTSLKNLVATKTCCKVTYIDAETRIWNMGHVVLPVDQVRNPVSLKQSLIITGPNAAGKTTYVRAICTNYILAQTFGIANGLKAEINPVHAIGSFIRISDELGRLSLFEAETKRCADLIKQAEDISNAGQRAIYFLDEPMHSTPPIEGSATSMAVIEHIGKLPGIKLLVTTHYHDLISLDNKYFKNLSVEAHLVESHPEKCSYKFKFPYKIKKGSSTQCIAIELLSDKDLPLNVIRRAIEVKNKLYPNIIN